MEVPGEASTEEPSAYRSPADESDAEAGAEADVERTQPMEPPEREEIRDVLEKLAKGELDVDAAAAALDAAREASAPHAGPSPRER
jgi:hypothetical protein